MTQDRIPQPSRGALPSAPFPHTPVLPRDSRIAHMLENARAHSSRCRQRSHSLGDKVAWV
ncbi:hypothetical protein E2C01_052283 [Portunus trituberculatus]|uniref:Uncharacterized protein n=1 Tax=Portunus trituberculatus TaxID=210409 RepID=A0A5B7GM29_PORTR|nr:hypothetical protein [Portunus trituberculatus]